MVFRMAAAGRRKRHDEGKKEIKIMFIDVRKAHLNAECLEEVFVELPVEFKAEGRYARIRRWLYGMRKAAASWEEEVRDEAGGGGICERKKCTDGILQQGLGSEVGFARG